ncbi:MAG: BadF/BadG/BcrA/BcrD ATPase family protein [Paracoccaceae bacterium]
MADSPDIHFLAVDGGGTRCRMALSMGDQVHVVETGSANVSSDFDAAVGELHNGLKQLSQASGLADLSNVPGYFGLAGVTGSAIADRLAAVVPLHRIRIEDDRPAALRGALGTQDGVLAHCGTGSFLCAQIAGNTRQIGGWGPVLGDEASAFWVGRMALNLTLAAVDGLHPHSALSQAILDRFNTAADIVAFAGQATQKEMGEVATYVTTAPQDDPLAGAIMQRASAYVYDAASWLGWTEGMALCLSGGIGPTYAPYLPEPAQATLVDPLGSPLDGALDLARGFAQEELA